MNLGILDILVILLITIGPTKAAVFFVGLTAGAEPALKRSIAIRTVATSAIICGAFVLIGEGLLGAFHVSLAALKIAGGLVLLLFALHLVLGEEKKDEAETGPRAPSLDVSVYPLAMPLMATPQGLVAIVTLAANMRGGGGLLMLLALVLAVMALNLVFLLYADRILGLVGPSVLKVVMRVFGLLLCGLAVQLMILGGQDLGVIPRDVAAGGGH
jgi:multiple antibiotic resistance protein